MHIWVIRQSASTLASMRPTLRRRPGSSQAVPSAVRRERASATSFRTCERMVMMCCANAVPRSKRSVTFVTRQPSFSAPTRFATGTRASSRNTSQKWLSPSSVRIGRTSTPGWCMSRISHVMPLCFGASGSVRTSSSQ